jgi:hypothetical protein
MMYQADEKPIPRTRSERLIIFSRIASFVFHPLLMTAFVSFAMYELTPDEFSNFSFSQFKNWFPQLLLYTVVLPFLLIFIFRVSGLISNARMHQPRDRIPPLVSTIVFYFLAYNLFIARNNFPVLFKMLLLGCCCAILIVFIVNFFYKVSVHTTAAAILPGICIALILNESIGVVLPLTFALLIAAFVGLIRWLLGAHTIGQILLGYAIGILTQVAAYFYFNT